MQTINSLHWQIKTECYQKPEHSEHGSIHTCFGVFLTIGPTMSTVLLWREEIADFNNIFADRISVKESYENILADVEEGIKNLPDYTTSKRLSKQMAQVIKAKLLMNRGWAGDYAAALAIVNDIIATAPALFKMGSPI